jgi:hypothetical protein
VTTSISGQIDVQYVAERLVDGLHKTVEKGIGATFEIAGFTNHGTPHREPKNSP